MHVYQWLGHLFTVMQRKVSVIKHRCLFLFNTQLIFLASWLRAERRTAAVVDFYTLVSAYSCCSCTQMRSMKLLFGSQNSRSLNTTNFRFLKRRKLVFKNHTIITVSSKCQGEAHTLPSVVVRTSFEIFARFSTYALACVDCHKLCRSSVEHGV